MTSKRKSPLWTYFEDYENDPEVMCKYVRNKNNSRGDVGRKAFFFFIFL